MQLAKGIFLSIRNINIQVEGKEKLLIIHITPYLFIENILPIELRVNIGE